MICKPDFCDAGAVLYQLSYRANCVLVIMWVDYKPVDDGYRSIYLILIHADHVLELQIKTSVFDS